MLVLTRKVGEKIRIGPDIELMVVRIDGNAVRLGVVAPREVPISRVESREGKAPATPLSQA